LTSSAEDVSPVRPGDALDWGHLESHLRSVLDLPADPMAVRQFTAGRANLTYLLEFGTSRFVLRRPPRGTAAPGAHDMAREHRVLSRLGLVYPRAPLALHFSDDTSIIGAPFVVLEHRAGEVIRDQIPESMAHHADVSRRVDVALLHAAADLHATDVGAAGLDDLGRPDGFGARQVSGWRNRWDRAAPDGASTTMFEVADLLADSIPAPKRVAVVHNDLKLDNCQFDPTDPDTVTSVFDWDMATIGDPLFDLGTMIVSMQSRSMWVLSTDEAVSIYAARTGVDIDSIRWYLAFATWRTAVVIQQLANRYLSGDSSDERLASIGRQVPEVAERARALLPS
jgi:aminoglycoside phosphotransferase (APT) family kinase protein